MSNLNGESLPRGWEIVRLRDVVRTLRPKVLPSAFPDLKFIGMEHIEAHTTRLLATVPASTMKSSAVYFQPGDILYGRLRPYLNKVLFAKFAGLCSAEFIVLTSETGINAHLLQYLLNSSPFVSFSSSLNTGDRPRVDFEGIGDYRFALPPSAEQRSIVGAIESLLPKLDAAVAALERVRANLKRYRASVLKAAVEGRLVPTEADLARKEGRDFEPASMLLERILAERRRRWEESELARMKAAGKPPKDDHWKSRYKEPVAPDTSTLPQLPTGWCWTTLCQLKEFSLYGPRFSSDKYSADGYLVLRTSDISESGKVNLRTAPRISLTFEEAAAYILKRGDLLVTRTGSIGTLAVFDDSVNAIAGAYLIQYRLATPDQTRWFLFYLLKSPEGQRRLSKGGAGVGRPNLNAPTIEAIVFGLPPLAEQARIVAEVDARLSQTEAILNIVDINIARCARLRQAILKWAFEGKLVDQDPNDEPASVLLERIRAERVAMPSRKSRKSNDHQTEAAK